MYLLFPTKNVIYIGREKQMEDNYVLSKMRKQSRR